MKNVALAPVVLVIGGLFTITLLLYLGIGDPFWDFDSTTVPSSWPSSAENHQASSTLHHVAPKQEQVELVHHTEKQDGRHLSFLLDFPGTKKQAIETTRRNTQPVSQDSPSTSYDVIERVKRESENGDYKNFDYNDYMDEEKSGANKESLLESWNKKYKKQAIVAVVAVNLLLCVTCCVCLLCRLYCRELCQALARIACLWCDKCRRRDPNYRQVVQYFKRLDIQPPSYEQYSEMKEAYGIILN